MSKSLPNYSATQVAVITNFDGPLDKDAAITIALQIGKSPRSVIAKIKSLGMDYIVQRPVRGYSLTWLRT